MLETKSVLFATVTSFVAQLPIMQIFCAPAASPSGPNLHTIPFRSGVSQAEWAEQDTHIRYRHTEACRGLASPKPLGNPASIHCHRQHPSMSLAKFSLVWYSRRSVICVSLVHGNFLWHMSAPSWFCNSIGALLPLMQYRLHYYYICFQVEDH